MPNVLPKPVPPDIPPAWLTAMPNLNHPAGLMPLTVMPVILSVANARLRAALRDFLPV